MERRLLCKGELVPKLRGSECPQEEETNQAGRLSPKTWSSPLQASAVTLLVISQCDTFAEQPGESIFQLMFVLYSCRMSSSPMQVRFQTTKSKQPSRLRGPVYNYKLLLTFISIGCNIKKPIKKLLYRHGELNPVLCDNPEGWEGARAGMAQEGGDICILLSDSCCCMAEANTIL